jgi:hypothetical protein
MRESEAAGLVKAELSTLSTEEARYIAQRFRGHPLAITRVCAILPCRTTSVYEFCDQLDTGWLLGPGVSTADGRLFAEAIRHTISLLMDRDNLSLELLKLLSVYDVADIMIHGMANAPRGDNSNISPDPAFLTAYLKTFDINVTPARLTRAIATLRDFSLIRLSWSDDRSPLIHINELMTALLLREFHQESADILRRIQLVTDWKGPSSKSDITSYFDQDRTAEWASRLDSNIAKELHCAFNEGSASRVEGFEIAFLALGRAIGDWNIHPGPARLNSHYAHLVWTILALLVVDDETPVSELTSLLWKMGSDRSGSSIAPPQNSAPALPQVQLALPEHAAPDTT